MNKTVKSRIYWSKEEVDFLVRSYGKLESVELAKRLNRSVSSIHTMVHNLRCRGVLPGLKLAISDPCPVCFRDEGTWVKVRYPRRGNRVFGIHPEPGGFRVSYHDNNEDFSIHDESQFISFDSFRGIT